MIFRTNTNDEIVFNSVYYYNEYKIDKFLETDIILDIGGHIGSFALKAWDYNSRNIYTYEPFMENFQILSKNVQDKDIHIFQKAVRGNYRMKNMQIIIGDNIKNAEIKNYGGLCLAEGNDIDVITLEEIIQNLSSNVKLMKLDCEGSEYSIIFESPEYIFEKIENIVGEVHLCDLPINFVNGKSLSHTDFVDKLISLGYTVKYQSIANDNSLALFFATRNNK